MIPTGSNGAFSELKWTQVLDFVADQVLGWIHQRTASLESDRLLTTVPPPASHTTKASPIYILHAKQR